MTREIQIAIWVVLGVALAISVVTDVRSRKILNIVTFPAILACLLLRVGAGLKADALVGSLSGPGLAGGLMGMAVGAIPLFLISLLPGGGMGMGDVKLAAAVGAGLGFPAVGACLFFIAIVGGIEAVVVLIWKGKTLKTFGGMGRKALQLLKIAKPDDAPPEKTYIPYGVAIAVGTVWGVYWLNQSAAVV
ncbi:MAG: prepilin peptidase [Myxococcales bacterium]